MPELGRPELPTDPVPCYFPQLLTQVLCLPSPPLPLPLPTPTCRDDVGDHAQWAKHFNAPRILHADEVVPDTEGVEVKLTGAGPWTLPDNSSDITLIFTPGHTSAHVCLYYAPEQCLFTGDHLAAGFTPDETLAIFKDFNWFSVPEQLASVRKLLDYDWLHVLPGHGR